VLIELALSSSALLLYRKAELDSLLYCAVSVWLAYFYRPLLVLLVASLALVLRDAAKLASLK
jgi:hypothetical protein